MNESFQMQGGKNWILPKEMNTNRFSGTLIGWKSGQTTFFPVWDRMEGSWLWTLHNSRGLYMLSFTNVEYKLYYVLFYSIQISRKLISIRTNDIFVISSKHYTQQGRSTTLSLYYVNKDGD